MWGRTEQSLTYLKSGVIRWKLPRGMIGLRVLRNTRSNARDLEIVGKKAVSLLIARRFDRTRRVPRKDVARTVTYYRIPTIEKMLSQKYY